MPDVTTVHTEATGNAASKLAERHGLGKYTSVASMTVIGFFMVWISTQSYFDRQDRAASRKELLEQQKVAWEAVGKLRQELYETRLGLTRIEMTLRIPPDERKTLPPPPSAPKPPEGMP